MPLKHYKHIEVPVKDFFKLKGFEVELEPQGSRGPDLVSKCSKIVGEIKASEELARDLKSVFWSAWNSNQSFGGKTPDYKLRSEFSMEVETLSGEAKGWIATIYGQLRNYCTKANLNEGWLIFEDYERYGPSLKEALFFLESQGKIESHQAENCMGIGFVKIKFQESIYVKR